MRKKQRKVASLASSSDSQPHSTTLNVLLWLRQDLRLHDNAALVAAARQAQADGGKLTLVYVHSPDEDGDDVTTGAVQLLHLMKLSCKNPSKRGLYCTATHSVLRVESPSYHVARLVLAPKAWLERGFVGSAWRPAGASLLWLHHALQSLDTDLQKRFGRGASIVYKRGPYLAALQSVAEAAGAGAVHFTSRYQPAMQVGGFTGTSMKSSVHGLITDMCLE